MKNITRIFLIGGLLFLITSCGYGCYLTIEDDGRVSFTHNQTLTLQQVNLSDMSDIDSIEDFQTLSLVSIDKVNGCIPHFDTFSWKFSQRSDHILIEASMDHLDSSLIARDESVDLFLDFSREIVKIEGNMEIERCSRRTLILVTERGIPLNEFDSLRVYLKYN